MNGIDRVKEKMKEKISLDVFSQNMDANEKSARKIYSLTREDNMMLKKIFSKRLNLENGTSISTLMSEAIQLLYNQEFHH